MNIKRLWENWNEYISEIKTLAERQAVVEYSIMYKLRIDRRETRAVIEDTLARIRAIPNITVVTSNTKEESSSPSHALVDVEFKFLPVRDEKQIIRKQLNQIKNEMKTKAYVDGVVILYNTIRKVE
tara:strand:- start:1722 stop:2099 length:378 start_codon:yes stop_codon:yes gene_type:complete